MYLVAAIASEARASKQGSNPNLFLGVKIHIDLYNT